METSSTVSTFTNIQFLLNGRQHSVPNNVHPATRLSDYIRQVAQLKGTKVMCREGGCGVCVVTVQYTDHVTDRERTRAINSCLCPIYIARGWKITTTEGLGGKQNGFHPIQQRMADHNATQCGFCTPGFVMSMYGLLKDNPSPSVDDVMKSIDGNLCRCTGYRSIVDALTSFTKDGANAQPVDIEEIHNLKCVKKQNCKVSPQSQEQIYKNWQIAQTLSQLYGLLEHNKGKRCKLVFGNTASGVYKKERYDMYFDIRNIPQLYKVQLDENTLELGANLTLTDLQDVFAEYKGKTGFEYLKRFSAHIDVIANKPIRNSGSWAGNLMIQHAHPEFLADMLPPLEALGAKIIIGSSGGDRCVGAQALMSEDMSTKVILSVRLPALGEHETFSVYKVMVRQQSAHGYITAAFRVSMNENVVKDVAVVFGGLNPEMEHHALLTEKYLCGQALSDDQVKLKCLNVLTNDLVVSEMDLAPKEYRSHLAYNLLYKFLCEFDGTNTQPQKLERPMPRGQQDYETFPDKYPMTDPLPKIDGELQTSGEVVYLDDIPMLDNELAALLVLSTIGKGNIDNIDTTAALAMPGVVDVVTADDIPGENLLNPIQLLADDVIEYNGQPLAIILAEDLSVAYRALGLVRVTYKNVEKPVVELEEAVQRGDVLSEVEPQIVGNTQVAMAKCARVIEGNFKHGSQFHFYLENQGCLVVPHEDSYQVWSATQTTNWVQTAIATALGINASSVMVTAPRVGGGFGGKMMYAAYFAALTALGAAKTNRPVRLNPSLETCIKVSGHRASVMGTYKIGVDENGLIQAWETQLYWDSGHRADYVNASFAYRNVVHSDGGYNFPNMLGNAKVMKTNTQIPAPMRAPGQLPGHTLAETMMDHVAHELGVDPITLRQNHLCKQGQMIMSGDLMPIDNIHILWEEAMKSADVRIRQKGIEAFNKQNRWVKRGLSMSTGKYLFIYRPTCNYTAYLAVYQHDGSVVIAHGGIEFGQGLDTKVTQVAMKMLGIPQDLIKCVRCNTLTSPNTFITAASITSEYLCRTVQECCKSLLVKLEPIKQKHPEAGWKTLVHEAHMAGVHMAVTEKYVSPTEKKLDYPTLGVLVAEAEVDILTGENQILRADVHMDIGESVNPAVDVGQVEGALIIGLGMMLREREVMDPETGEMLTASTWDYKPPTACDIPADLRVNLLKGKPNTLGVFSSKALGEPPICTTPAFLMAVKAAVAASRRERGKTQYFQLNAPATPADILTACDVTAQDLV